LPTGEITSLLRAWTQGDADARDRLASLVYNDLRRVARARLRARAPRSLSPTDVVHEAFVRLIGQEARWVNRAHFFAVAAEMIRRVLVDHERARRAHKRGGKDLRIDLSDVKVGLDPKGVDLLALDKVLRELEDQDPQQARVVELRYFGGLTFDEIAKEVGISASAAKRDWETARLWLKWRLGSGNASAKGQA
jgi:RNA polymerase sigma factor (TIGR02999 family)